MSITRTTLLGGPAATTFNGHTFFAQDGILVTPALELAAVDSDTQGVLDETVSSGPVTIKFTPTAPFADLVALYPYAMGAAGMSLFGTSDAPLALTAANGVRLTFAAASSGLDGTVISGGPADAPVTAKIIQCVSQDLLLRSGCFNGQTAIFPFPHHAPFI